MKLNSYAKHHGLITKALIAVYVIFVLVFSVSSKAAIKPLPIYNWGPVETFTGSLVVNEDGKAHLVVYPDQETKIQIVRSFRLVSQMDLSDLHGHMVEVQGKAIESDMASGANSVSMSLLLVHEVRIVGDFL